MPLTFIPFPSRQDNQSMPSEAQPWPEHILAFGPKGEWTDAIPNLHFGVHEYAENNTVGENTPLGIWV